jgi:dGTP triphosphohydrolase
MSTVDDQFPSMSTAKLSLDAFIAVEVLKTLAFEAVIMSSRLKSAENRGRWIVKQIYDELVKGDGGYLLMPEDWRSLVEAPAAVTPPCRPRWADDIFDYCVSAFTCSTSS